MLVQTLQYDVKNKSMKIIEEDMTFPDPRIAEIEKLLQEIPQKLNASDWKTIKYLEGAMSEEVYQIHLQERASLRVEYNALEQELAIIKEAIK